MRVLLCNLFERCVGCVFDLHVAVVIGEYWVACTVFVFFGLCSMRNAALHGAALSVAFCAVVSVCLCVRLLLSATCWSPAKIYFSVLLFSSNAEVARGVVFRCKQHC